MTIRPQTTVKGKFVVTDDGAGISWDAVRIQLRPTEPLPTLINGAGQRTTVVDARTREFSIDVTQSRFHILVAGLPTNVYVADILQGNQSVFNEGVDTGNETMEPLEIVLRSGGGTIQGSVQPAIARAPIVLRPATLVHNPQLYKRSTTVNTGQFP